VDLFARGRRPEPAAPVGNLSRRAAGAAILALALTALSCSKSGPQLIASSTVNGKTVKVFSDGGPERVALERNGDTTRVTFGSHEIVINPDGSVSIDGTEKPYGKFTEIDITIGAGDKIDIKVIA
jgi:hypothetical protein